MLRAETYVVHIYRREGALNRAPKGVVEIVRQRRYVSFNGFEALRAILASPTIGVRKRAGRPPGG